MNLAIDDIDVNDALAHAFDSPPDLLRPGPLERPRKWAALVNQDFAERELESVRTSAQRGRPYGSRAWVAAAARRLGLGFTLRPRGRPRKIRTQAGK